MKFMRRNRRVETREVFTFQLTKDELLGLVSPHIKGRLGQQDQYDVTIYVEGKCLGGDTVDIAIVIDDVRDDDIPVREEVKA